jgi:hypothetical protein
MIGEAICLVTGAVGRTVDSGERWLFDRKKATYGPAAMRILIGIAILGSLTVNFTNRHYVWGPGARWLTPWLTVDEYGAPFTWVFAQGDGTTAFTIKYLLLAALAVAFTIGWRTRVVTPVLMIAIASLMRLNPLGDDAGDNIVRIMLLFLCFADTSMRWSLDARRRARPGYRPLLPLPPWVGTLFHNVALVAVATQVFMIYMTSGLSKVQGSMWQEGVGLYYPLRIGQYAPWPGLNELVYTNGVFVTIGSYVTVFVQVLFPLLLLRRGTRVLALLAIFAMHVGIAVTMALPWFSLAMIAADMVFIRDDTYQAVIRWARRSRQKQPAEPSPTEPEPAEVP